MKLADYLEETGTRRAHLAQDIGVSRSTITDLCVGRRQPSIGMMRRIHEATDGKVTANDFMEGADE